MNFYRTLKPRHYSAPWRSRIVTSITAALLCLSVNSHAVNPSSTSTSTGQSLNIEISTPANGNNVDISSSLVVTGRVSIGPLPGGSSSSVIYVIDVSGSTSTSGNDCNNDGTIDSGDNFTPTDFSSGTVLDCEVGGVMALNDSLGSNGSINVAVVAFGTRAALAQPFIAPPNADSNGNGIADIDELLMQLDQGGGVVNVSVSTDFSDALTAMTAAFQSRPTNEQRVAYFLTDGLSGGSVVSEANAARDAGIRVETFSVGESAAACSGSNLEIISTTTGGGCTDVQDIDTLTAVIGGAGGVPPTGIDRVEIRLNGSANAQVSVDNLGNWTHTFGAGSLAAGANVIEATVFAGDGTATTADITVNAATINDDDPTPPDTPDDNSSDTPTTPDINRPTTHPSCMTTAADTDGDGWGWENNATCIVDNNTTGGGGMMPPMAPMGPAICSSDASDSDGDGWGWENAMSCLVGGSTAEQNLTANMTAHCTTAAVDPDGDGWGWENNASCVVPGSAASQIVD